MRATIGYLVYKLSMEMAFFLVDELTYNLILQNKVCRIKLKISGLTNVQLKFEGDPESNRK